MGKLGRILVVDMMKNEAEDKSENDENTGLRDSDGQGREGLEGQS